MGDRRPDIRQGDLPEIVFRIQMMIPEKLALSSIHTIIDLVQRDHTNNLANMNRIGQSELTQLFEAMGKVDPKESEKVLDLVLGWGRGLLARGVASEQKRLTTCSHCSEELTTLCPKCDNDD